jgi:hypothetical protein
MIDNIEKVLDRGEKLDLLVDKTELLQVRSERRLFFYCLYRLA